MISSPQRFLFVSSCPDAWGGSEELWSGAALQLLQRKNEVIIGRSTPMPRGCNSLRWDTLKQTGLIVNHFGSSWLLHTVPDVVLQLFPNLLRSAWWVRNFLLSLKLHRLRPHLVVICQGQAYDACYPFSIPEVCRFAKIPYVIICQKASELEWPSDGLRELMYRCYRNASCSYFVSRHNLRTVEQQLALRLPSAKVVQNPFMVRASKPLPWPESSDGVYRLACVARLWPLEKAQDVLLEVLNQARWRSRPIMVSFFGDGPMAIGLRQMAEMLNLRNVQFLGFVNATEIWRTHHALVLPSRSEGLPLVQVEAMMCGRPVIVANAGGSSEIIQHGVHGFLADGANPSSLDHALEQAWDCREEWKNIGLCAAQHVKTIYANDPCADFADELERLCHSITKANTSKLARQ